MKREKQMENLRTENNAINSRDLSEFRCGKDFLCTGEMQFNSLASGGFAARSNNGKPHWAVPEGCKFSRL